MPSPKDISGFLLVGLAGAFALLSRRTLAGEGPQSLGAVATLAQFTVDRHKFNVDPKMAIRIAYIESSFNPSAIRYEPHLGDASIGLMQTLLGTARWLEVDMGHNSHTASTTSLLDAQVSMYFGCAYLHWLRRWRGSTRSDEWVVRSYNGGPGHGKATDDYWRKYREAREKLG
ncbi:lytic transglycosylase domain-containing protein [Pelagibius sp.]|uniref:lytic transglycosylase domain-containing protein n=1 Tax=Pelagibius sp. TaxID=1931238 RepID=UPI0026130556|nr:lytic transglycosylase domain-containing protein [Pelagibius sp.]